ncbi:hypothetical protein ABBQ32_012223 [Trebouxia sp. C0010 RCD-2024]
MPEGFATAAALGFGHTLALTESGQLFEHSLTRIHTQDSSQGICQQTPHTQPIPWSRVQLHQPVTAVAAGEHHSVALTIDGSVWTWGANTDGQLGWPSPACALPQDGSPAIQMRVVVGPQASCAGSAEGEQTAARFGGAQQVMTAVACGARHTCCIGHMGQLLCWGWSLHGQCGQGRAVVSVPQPQDVRGLGGLKVVGVAAGLAHTVACTDSGDVYSWGWNADGQLGLGDDSGRGEPELVSDAKLQHEHIDQVSCGARHTLVRSTAGRAFVWGWNKYGQLGVGNIDNQVLPHDVHMDGSIVDVACGWWHSMLMLKAAV